MTWLHVFNCSIAALFLLCYSYQLFYIVYGCFKKSKIYPEVEPKNRYAVLIPARNEEAVIGQLIDSIKKQDYPLELLDIYVLADNCDDKTKEVAEASGAIVYERQNKLKVGKGFALEFLLNIIKKTKTLDYYDGYFIFDADNLLNARYITEMDKCLSAGNKIVTSYRNSKNYGTNWISAGYSLWFLREARFLNNVRTLLGTSCAVSGTGFLVHRDIIKKQNGWKHFLLTEDIEFTTDQVIQGESVAYCDAAQFYDEQPVTFMQSWNQRLRWSKGFLQVWRCYGSKLLRGCVKEKRFSCYDMLMTIAPAFVTSILTIVVNTGALAYALIFNTKLIVPVLIECAITFISIYLTLWFVGAISGIYEWKNIRCSVFKKIKSFFTLPFFMLTYIPISITALFKNVTWKDIQHHVSDTIDSLEGNA